MRVQREAFRRFQSPAIADTLAKNPRFLLEPVQQNAAILFVDLSGFTGLSEQLGAQRTRDFLKEFHSIIEDEALRYNGYVESFMGDGAMLVFGLPTSRPRRCAARDRSGAQSRTRIEGHGSPVSPCPRAMSSACD